MGLGRENFHSRSREVELLLELGFHWSAGGFGVDLLESFCCLGVKPIDLANFGDLGGERERLNDYAPILPLMRG